METHSSNMNRPKINSITVNTKQAITLWANEAKHTQTSYQGRAQGLAAIRAAMGES